MTLDEAILSAYLQLQVPVDQILTDPPLAEQFAELVRSFLGNSAVETRTILQRLLTLRKRGEDNGGLSRLQAA